MRKIADLFDRYREVISYLFWGVLTTAVNLGTFWLIHHFTSIGWLVNNTIAWFVSVLFAYITNKAYVFHSASTTRLDIIKEIFFFFTGRIGSLGVEYVILYVGITLLSGNEMLVKLIDNVVIVVINYFWSKWAVFKKSKGN
ncbi:GtrA family protein [Lentilactobacillus sp. Marseille-Q4993]|uniref:GtrA family protein n=1 Tax=Lentilactobacillus sp. Marseille-Q4993 TaxID=3039492 RepID=UPI0024BC79CC|nr:GtrA family protein [Lentilactobacillus sp. Marseille-Q4993]